ncbi:MAG: NUDIX hydrolase [Thermomicrobiales bacterium]
MKSERFTFRGSVHVLLVKEGRVLLLRRANTGYMDGHYSVPAGHLDGNETVIDAAIREAREEAGVSLTPDDVQVVGVMHRGAKSAEYIDFFVAATQWRGQLENREPHKCDELRWEALDQLPVTVIPYIRRALENYQQGRWFDTFGLA